MSSFKGHKTIDQGKRMNRNHIFYKQKYFEVSIEHLQQMRHANRGRLLLWTPGPFPLSDLQKF